MCEFFSAILMKNGDILWNPYTDSHEDLVALNNLRDTKAGNFVRLEFKPDEPTDLDKPAKYRLRVDESEIPKWVTDSLREKTIEKLQSIIKRMIIDGPVTCLIGGSYILTKGASIGFTKAVRVVAMLDSSKVNTMWDSSQVNEMRDSSKVNTMLGSSQVNEMLGSSQVNTMLGSSQVNEMRDSSKVNTMWGSSKVNTMRDSSKVNEMRDSSQVNTMWDSSQVNAMWDSSQVNEMRDSSKVNTMWDSSKAPKAPGRDERQ